MNAAPEIDNAGRAPGEVGKANGLDANSRLNARNQHPELKVFGEALPLRDVVRKVKAQEVG